MIYLVMNGLKIQIFNGLSKDFQFDVINYTHPNVFHNFLLFISNMHQILNNLLNEAFLFSKKYYSEKILNNHIQMCSSQM